MNNVILRPLLESDLHDLWEIAYVGEAPKWTKLNAPYFNEYKPMSWEKFLKEEIKYYVNMPANFGIFYKDKFVGNISYYWEHKGSRWMEIGLVIYDERYWGLGIGKIALAKWIDHTFRTFPEIERLGCTSWSGNAGMMKLAESVGMQLEGRMRKCRYHDGVYYDSLRYGILREEWEQSSPALFEQLRLKESERGR